MSKLSFEDILKWLKNEMSYNDFITLIQNKNPIDYLGDYKIVYEKCDIVKNYVAVKVIYFINHDIYIEICGYYYHFEDNIIYNNNYHIYSYYPLKEVRPYEVINTFYKRIK